jgi:PIN domain nuclease of toxin-antitoxin system
LSLLLLDTHLLLWVSGVSSRLPAAARTAVSDPANTIAFSAASLWEIAIKAGQGRTDFRIELGALRRGLLQAGYRELAVTGEHAIAVGRLPSLHKDPFDRILIAQADIEGAELLTVDPMVARYPGRIQLMA